MAQLADAEGLNPSVASATCGFDPRPGHWQPDRGLLGLGPAPLVFCAPEGEPLHSDAVTRRFNTLVRWSGLQMLRGPHNLRHTWASLALAAGAHPKVVYDRLGHSTIAVTIDTHSHAIPSLDADAAVALASQLFSTKDAP